ncbi:MAG: GC-type dockerin domain-anchored protein [Phycisphaerales bacterium]
MIGFFDANGTLYAYSDDVFDGTDLQPESWLSFGDQEPRTHAGTAAQFTGRDGSLPAGAYYLAAGAWRIEFNDGFFAGIDSISPGGPALRVNIYSGFSQEPAPCSSADVGVAGGSVGHDRVLNNNDFIAFITLFFGNDPAADLGVAGGTPGSDGAWNNNDFIAFINAFFNDQAACTG